MTEHEDMKRSIDRVHARLGQVRLINKRAYQGLSRQLNIILETLREIAPKQYEDVTDRLKEKKQ